MHKHDFRDVIQWWEVVKTQIKVFCQQYTCYSSKRMENMIKELESEILEIENKMLERQNVFLILEILMDQQRSFLI